MVDLMLVGGSLTLFDQYVGQLVTLSLALCMGAQPGLQELQRSLIFRHSQVLKTTLFVRCEAGDLTNDRSDELVVLGQTLLGGWMVSDGGFWVHSRVKVCCCDEIETVEWWVARKENFD